jgi:hypothetical protein
MELVDESCLIEARAYVLDVARMSRGVVQARRAQIRIEAINESTPPETVFLAAERALPELEAL